MKPPITGDCLCGLIRYESSAESAACVKCHCGFCQKTTGTSYLALIFAPSLFDRNSTFIKIRPVAAATLDNLGFYKPKNDMWVVDAQPWRTLNPDLPKCGENF